MTFSTGNALLYLIGEPAAGKSAAMRALTAGLTRVHVPVPLRHEWIISPGGARVALEIGRTGGRRPGTDALPLSVSPDACRWINGRPAPIVLAEGDRLAHVRFLEDAAGAGYRLHIAYLHADTFTVDNRCLKRGSSHTEAWRRGRATKAANLYAYASGQHGYETLMIDTGSRSPEQVANVLRGAWPFLDALPRPAAAP